MTTQTETARDAAPLTGSIAGKPLHPQAPTGTQTRDAGTQRFHVVKIVFPRGDAASLLMGLNADGKITGISLMSMAGD